VRAVRDPCHFLLFILFFPHLVAGPIVRARHFLPQAARRKRWSWPRIHAGVLLILLGVIKKLAVADRMALYVDPVFADPAAHGTVALWLAAIAYALQVYCDFSGYTDMALGLAQLFGYHLAPNFNLPFLSANMAEFWRRWHISLSSWIRDYLYIPLGGSHGGGWRTSRNILLTMALCGLWHGANWNYVLWGVLNGVLVVAHGAFRPWCARRPALDSVLRSVPGTTLRVAGTFACFCLTLAVFRAPGVRAAGAALSRMLMPAGGEGLAVRPLGLYLTIVAVALAHILAQDDRWQRWWERVPVPVRGLGFGTALSLAMILAPQASKAFIYFQF
jgi:alginate O-acetyltransferase complex protein AlgI